MKYKIICFFCVAIMIINPYNCFNTQNSVKSLNVNSIESENLDGGWIENINNVTILYLKGSSYQMGYQHGYLLKDNIEKHLRAQLNYFIDYDFDYNRILKIWNISKEFLPSNYIQELRGIANGSELPFNDIAVLNTIPLIFNQIINSCTGFAAWGSSTKNGNLYHMRSFDWYIDIEDPETKAKIQDLAILIVRKPIHSYSSFSPELPGWTCAWSGINEKGISIGEMTCFTDLINNKGISAAFRIRMVLDYASSIEDALIILNSNKTCGWNFIISDGKIPKAYFVEQNTNFSYVGTWDDLIESKKPFWKIDYVIRRTNFFIHPNLSKTQRKFYDLRLYLFPSLFYFLNNDWENNIYYRVWLRYKDLSKEIEKKLGDLDLNSSMNLTRDAYSIGFLKQGFIQLLNGFNNHADLWQWISCPKTGDILISFAKGDIPAHQSQVHYFNLFKLLEKKS